MALHFPGLRAYLCRIATGSPNRAPNPKETLMKPVLIFASTALVLTAGTAAFAAFADLDADGDGALSAAEFTTAFPDISGDVFLTIDANADGVISEDEHVAAVDAGLLPAE